LFLPKTWIFLFSNFKSYQNMKRPNPMNKKIIGKGRPYGKGGQVG
jgi:hypothetical protein